jgi:hypothetical protein
MTDIVGKLWGFCHTLRALTSVSVIRFPWPGEPFAAHFLIFMNGENTMPPMMNPTSEG